MSTEETSGRIFAISDLHVDYPKNRQFIQSWGKLRYKNDTLIVAGDVTDNLELLKITLEGFVKQFKYVFFVPGNFVI